MKRTAVNGSPVQPGKTVNVFPLEARPADTYQAAFAIDSEGLAVSLFCSAIVALDTIDVAVYTYTEEGRELLVLQMQQVTAASTQLQIEQAAPPLLSNILIRVTSTGPSTFEIKARAVAPPGEFGNQGCHRILEEIEIEAGGELLIDADACVVVTKDYGQGHQLHINSTSISEFK